MPGNEIPTIWISVSQPFWNRGAPAYKIEVNLTNVVYVYHQMHPCACVRMVENDRKYSKIMKKLLSFSESYPCYPCRKKVQKQQNSKWATSFWESLSIADQQTFFFIFFHASVMSLSCTWWKRYFLLHFRMFFYRFRPFECMSKHAFAGQNTQQTNQVALTVPETMVGNHRCKLL